MGLFLYSFSIKEESFIIKEYILVHSYSKSRTLDLFGL